MIGKNKGDKIMENKVFKGLPGLVLLPSHMYNLKIAVENYNFSVPVSGKFSEVYPDFYETAKKNKETDYFEVAVSTDAGVTHLLSVAMIELLFASKAYPDLKDNQVFAIGTITLDNDKNVLYVVGTVLEFMA